jgi:para-nitrobenzyl esterase
MILRRGAIILGLVLSYALMSSNVWMLNPVGSRASSDLEPAQAQNLSDPVQTEQGPVRGEVLGNTVVFRGVPYAAAPAGNLRWKPPQFPAQRAAVLDAVRFGPICPQFAADFPNPPSNTPSGSEDCLSLNIWAPKTKEATLRPVMFFIHGGSNTNGASSISIYDGRQLFEKGGVIAITINYRLGPLGFLGHPLLSAEDPNNSSGNYGLLDQILALQWVQRNIRNFGGDPNNVTIFGESAGGLDVSCLVASPLAAGLFDKAIVESAGQAAGPFVLNKPLRKGQGVTVETAEDFGIRLTAALGCDNAADPLACLRSKTPTELLTKAPPENDTNLSGASYGPNIDGYVLPGNILSILKSGRQNDVPLMIGTNKNEGNVFISSTINSEASYKAAVQEAFGDKADRVLARYPISDYGSPRAALDALITDTIFLCPARSMTRLIAPRQQKTYVYQFTQNIAILKDLGAFHGLELPFVFNNTFIIPGATQKDLKLSKRMLSYWTNFAKTGDPNAKGLPKWPVYTVDGDTNITLNSKIRTNKALRKDFCDFLSDLFELR